MAETFGRQRKLTRRVEFLRAYSQGRGYATRWFVCHVLDADDAQQPGRLGITASRRTGRAHQRNRYKRWAREVFRRQPIRNGVEVVVRFRSSIAEADFETFRKALVGAFARAGLLRE